MLLNNTEISDNRYVLVGGRNFAGLNWAVASCSQETDPEVKFSVLMTYYKCYQKKIVIDWGKQGNDEKENKDSIWSKLLASAWYCRGALECKSVSVLTRD